MKPEQSDHKKSTKELLLEAGMLLFSQYGYDGTSARMIASKCNSNLSAISFYYNGKRGLYDAVVLHSIEIIKEYYGNYVKKVEEYLTHPPDSEEAWVLIEELFRLIFQAVRNSKYNNLMILLLREQIDSHSTEHPLTQAIYQYCERPLMDLISSLCSDISRDRLAIRVRLIFRSFTMPIEHPAFLRQILSLPAEAEFDDSVLEEIRQFALSCIHQIMEEPIPYIHEGDSYATI